MKTSEKELKGSRQAKQPADAEVEEVYLDDEIPVLDEIVIEELAVDGICGIY